jgi:dTDP-4-amino-4,6-dideoxygalactose transaminase
VEPIRFPFLRPSLPTPDQWLSYLEPSYAARRYTNFGPVNNLFERRLEEFVGIPNRRAVACANATVGLSAVLMGLGVKGNVAIPSFTFPATLHSVLLAGCNPVVCDVDAGTWELSPSIVKSALERHQINAVMHVRAFGFCRDLHPIARVCESAGIPLVVDAAAALGGSISPGVLTGGQGTAEVFSLHATKVLGIGEGGAVFCHPDHGVCIARALNFGLGGTGFSRALNGKLSEFAGAVGLAVLDAAAPTIAARAMAARRYLDFFAEVDGLAAPGNPGAPPWQCFPVLFPEGTDVVLLLEAARRNGLELRRYYRPAIHHLAPPEFATKGPLPAADALAERMVCFPVYPAMSEEEQAVILNVTRTVLAEVAAS